MEKIFEQAMLYDFYGELLNEHQKAVFEEYVLDNLSLSEIAEARAISRQAVHDMIKRADRLLHEYEDKLHLVKKFMTIKEKVGEINGILGSLNGQDESSTELKRITQEIIDEL